MYQKQTFLKNSFIYLSITAFAQPKKICQSLFFYILEYFSYTQEAFVFHLKEDFYIVCGHISHFVFIFVRKISISFTSMLTLFVVFFFRKILISFTSLYSKPFFVLLIISTPNFYIFGKKII